MSVLDGLLLLGSLLPLATMVVLVWAAATRFAPEERRGEAREAPRPDRHR